MTKPWEETWIVMPTEFGPWRIMRKGNVLATFGDGCTAIDGAQLAAAAPEMARLLLALESGSSRRFPECPSCSEKWLDGPTQPHADDCNLVAVLKKAGVR